MTQLVLHTGTPMTRLADVRTRLVAWRDPLTKVGVILHPQDRVEAWDRAVQQLVTGEPPVPVRKLLKKSAKFGARTVLLSSEDAYRPLRKGRNLKRIVDLGSASEAGVKVVLVVREQLGMLNAVYCRHVMSMEGSSDFETFVAKAIDSGAYQYAQAFRALLDAEDVELVAVPFSALEQGNPARAILAATGLPSDLLDGLPAGRPETTDGDADPEVGPVLLTAARLLHKRLTRLGLVRQRQPGALAQAFGVLRDQARENAWDDTAFWGWTPELATLATKTFRHGNAEFAAGAWRSDWPDPSPDRAYTRTDLASRAPALVVDVMDTVQRAVDELTSKRGMPADPA